jgi:PAS domain S-box-containing protein
VAIRADITERKRAEQALRESEERFRTMANSAPTMIWISGVDKLCTWFNKQWLEFVGQTMDGEVGAGWTRNVHPDDLAECLRIYGQKFDARANFTLEYRLRHRDGGWRWIIDHGNPRYGPDNEFVGYVGCCLDVTARKRAEDRVQASLNEVNELKMALDEHAIVAITDPQGKITYVNDKFCAISKYSRAELLGQDHRLINSGFHSQQFIREIWRTIARGEVWKGEIKNKAKDGSYYWVATTIVPFLNEDGRPRQYVAIRADITERKAAEDEIRKLNVELEQRVADRTAELEAFSYSVSHDLRAPLRAMCGYARILQEDFGKLLPPEARQKLQRIDDNANKLGQLIDGLLAFSRLSRQPLSKRLISPELIVNHVLEELQPDHAGRRINLRTSRLPACQADPTLLQQVFANLLSNAFKYSRHRDPAEIEIGAQTGARQCVYFVRDNGAGFEMQYAHKLFGVFQRLHRAEQFEGTGVGLAIAHRIVNRHGGRIWAESQPDNGATFYFTLQGEDHA